MDSKTNAKKIEQSSGDKPQSTTIHKEVWDDYYKVQLSGRINMMMHPNVGLFIPQGRWEQSHRHFVIEKQTTPLVFEVVHSYPCKGWRTDCVCNPVEVVA